MISQKTLVASEPQVALDDAGDAVAVWLSYDGSEYSYLAASRAGPSGAWGPPVTLKKIGAQSATDPRPDLAVDAGGDAVVVWQRPNGSAATVEAASRSGPAGTWSTPETISENGEDMHPAEVAIDAAGSATAVWEERGTPVRTDAAERPAGGKWNLVGPISSEESNANEPRVAVDGKGQAVAVWEQFNGELGEIVDASSRPGPKAAWGAVAEVTDPHVIKEPAGQQVAIDGQGHAVVTWSRVNAGGQDLVEAAVGGPAASTWSVPVVLSSPAGLTEETPHPAVDSAGDAVVVWEQWSGAMKIVEAASGSALTGAWKPAVALSAEGHEADQAQVALDPQGNAAAVWRRFDGSFYRVEAAGLDAAGPALDGLSVPAGGIVGQLLAFSVSPFDTWSPLGATSWTLGDGSTAAGTSITHAYAAPGAYTVTVTAADALGNSSSLGATIQITAPASSLPVPLIKGARLTHGRFRVAAHPTAVSARVRPPLCTAFDFSLNEAARVQITFTRKSAGRRSRGRCVAPTARLRAHHARRCTRTVKPGTLTRAAEHSGSDTIAFSGRIGRRPLAPGAYHAALTATASGLASAPVTLAFSVVR